MAALVESPEGRVFLARRAASLRHGGLWELPGGKIEAGESPEEALLRELREELGLEASLLGPARVFRSELGDRAFEFHVFPASLPEEPRVLAAHDAYAFVSFPDLPTYALAPLDGEALDLWGRGLF